MVPTRLTLQRRLLGPNSIADRAALYHKAIYLIINWYVPQKASNEYCIRIRLLIATL